jgi:hypothetical protein
MIKELKNLFFVLIIFLFIFFTLKHYFSDDYKKHSYRSLKENHQNVFDYSRKLILLENDTKNVVEYVERMIDKNKKNYNFWKLLNNNE